MLGLYGNFTASDKWSMIWALDRAPQYIRTINPRGVQDSIISGTIDLSLLQRKLKQFKRTHHTAQLRLFP